MCSGISNCNLIVTRKRRLLLHNAPVDDEDQLLASDRVHAVHERRRPGKPGPLWFSPDLRGAKRDAVAAVRLAMREDEVRHISPPPRTELRRGALAFVVGDAERDALGHARVLLDVGDGAEEEPVRNQPVTSSTRRGHGDNVASMAWNLHVIVQTQLRGHHRGDVVERLAI